MDFDTRECLANEFEGVIRTTREDKWGIFCEAAKESNLDPYVALARLLTRIVEAVLDGNSVDPEQN